MKTIAGVEQSCSSCAFWEKLVNNDAVGKCKRHSPVIVAPIEQCLTALWPVTYFTEWCGDYTAAQGKIESHVNERNLPTPGVGGE